MSRDQEILCPNGRAVKESQLRVAHRYGPQKTVVYRCPKCKERFSERVSSVFAGFHTDDRTIYRVLKALCEGNGIRATARIFGIDRKTFERILQHAAAHCQKVSERLITNYHLTGCQLDELWSFVKEARLSTLEKLAGIYGDQWVWISFDLIHKVVITFVVGRHIQKNANRLVQGTKDRSDGQIPLFTSDELKHYDDALLKAYGIKHEVPRTGKRGRPRNPQCTPPDELLYAQVVKRRRKGGVVDITVRVIFGSEKGVAERLSRSSVSKHINTSFVERENLTLRHHNRRLTRKTIAFSKKQERLLIFAKRFDTNKKTC